MTAPFAPTQSSAAAAPSELSTVILICQAVRVWTKARAEGAPAQRALFRMLNERGQGLLAPVFDGLFTCAEIVREKPLLPGSGCAISPDEARLCVLLEAMNGPGGPSYGRVRNERLLTAAVASARTAMRIETATAAEQGAA